MENLRTRHKPGFGCRYVIMFVSHVANTVVKEWKLEHTTFPIRALLPILSFGLGEVRAFRARFFLAVEDPHTFQNEKKKKRKKEEDQCNLTTMMICIYRGEGREVLISGSMYIRVLLGSRRELKL